MNKKTSYLAVTDEEAALIRALRSIRTESERMKQARTGGEYDAASARFDAARLAAKTKIAGITGYAL